MRRWWRATPRCAHRGRRRQRRHRVGLARCRHDEPMKEVRLAYGHDGILARVPDTAVVVTATELPGLPDEAAAVLEALRAPVTGPPLSQIVRDAMSRPGRVPRRRIQRTRRAPAVRRVWRWCSPISRDRCPIAPCSLRCWPSSNDSGRPRGGRPAVCHGTHRLATEAEMVELVGPDIAERYTIHQHRADGVPDDHVEVARWTGPRCASTAATWTPTSAS